MVFEKRILFEVGDVVAMRAVCGGCEGEIIWTPKNTTNGLPFKCPFCDQQWKDDYHTLWQLSEQFITLLRNDGKNRKTSFRLRFEINKP